MSEMDMVMNQIDSDDLLPSEWSSPSKKLQSQLSAYALTIGKITPTTSPPTTLPFGNTSQQATNQSANAKAPEWIHACEAKEEIDQSKLSWGNGFRKICVDKLRTDEAFSKYAFEEVDTDIERDKYANRRKYEEIEHEGKENKLEVEIEDPFFNELYVKIVEKRIPLLAFADKVPNRVLDVVDMAISALIRYSYISTYATGSQRTVEYYEILNLLGDSLEVDTQPLVGFYTQDQNLSTLTYSENEAQIIYEGTFLGLLMKALRGYPYVNQGKIKMTLIDKGAKKSRQMGILAVNLLQEGGYLDQTGRRSFEADIIPLITNKLQHRVVRCPDLGLWGCSSERAFRSYCYLDGNYVKTPRGLGNHENMHILKVQIERMNPPFEDIAWPAVPDLSPHRFGGMVPFSLSFSSEIFFSENTEELKGYNPTVGMSNPMYVLPPLFSSTNVCGTLYHNVQSKNVDYDDESEGGDDEFSIHLDFPLLLLLFPCLCTDVLVPMEGGNHYQHMIGEKHMNEFTRSPYSGVPRPKLVLAEVERRAELMKNRRD